MSSNSSPVLITGVGKRIGFALCKHFIQQGIPVVGTYRTAHEHLNELASADLICCDFYQQQAISNLIKEVTHNYAGLRAIIHNASDWLPESADFGHEEIFIKMMQIHAGVPYQLNFAFEKLLRNYGHDCADIIHITDFLADKGSQKHVAYAASKAAVANMTLSFSSLFAPDIKVNSIAPSLIMFNPNDDAEYRSKALDKSLLKIEPGVGEVVSAVDYLMQSNYMTGRTLSLDGGRHLR